MRGGMKGTIGALVLGALLVASAPAVAGAQARGYVGIGGGVSLPIGDFKDGVKLGFLGQVTGGVTLPNGILGFRVDGTYGLHKEKDPGTETIKLLSVTGDVVVSPKTSGKAAPYVLAGAGMLNIKNGGSESAFAWNAGAGVVLKSSKVGVYVEARFLSATKDGNTNSMIPVTVGVRIGGQ